MPFAPPTYTQTPNELLDGLLPQIDSLSELKVTLVIVRQTLGWHREERQLSLSELQRRTGLTRESVSNGVQRALERQTIVRVPEDDSFAYSLAIEVVGDSDQEVVGNSDPSRARGVGSESKEREKQNEDAQASLLPDPVNETWEVYVKALGRPRVKLNAKVRKWIRDAHEAVGEDATRQAIRGLAASQYHRDNGYIGIEHAIRPKQNETIEGRIAFMAAKAPGNGSPTEGDISQLLADFRGDNGPVSYQTFVSYIDNINRWLHNRDSRKLKSSAEAQMAEIERWGYELVIGKPDGRDREFVTGYRKVA